MLKYNGTHSEIHTWIIMLKARSVFMQRSKGWPNHWWLLRFYNLRMTVLLSPLPLHLSDWQMGAGRRMERGGCWVIMGRCVTVRARSRTYLSLSRWHGKGRGDVAGPYLKAPFTVPTQATLAFPNGASQLCHAMLCPAIPVLKSCHCTRSIHKWNDSQVITVQKSPFGKLNLFTGPHSHY